ncbi:MAG: DNA primase [Deltaproteobacteria bacterium]|nr:DNA primase [Deltaproteobacteria bacterium]NIS78531.1 DNA primase [Deltaproteobacteria bacterium]
MNGRISRRTLEELRLRSDIVGLVSEYVDLRRAGSSLKGLCPFHREKTPSFFVSSEKGVFHCFGCGTGGDSISFLMQLKKLEYRDAVEELCARAGVEVVVEGGRDDSDTVRTMFDINRFAADFYHNLLFQKGNRANTYLQERGIEEDTARELLIGYGGRGRRELARAIAIEGLDANIAVESGLLLKRKNGELVDRFAGRIIFPIFTVTGKIAGFAGRSMDDAGPKYINSSESRIYRKKNLLYGLNLSGRFIREEGKVFVVEGYTDWLILWQAGIKNVVATCGTAVTPGHFRELKRISDKVVLLFDGDMAGKKAAVRSVSPAYEAGVSPLVFFPPGRLDPDEWVRKAGVEEVRRELAEAKLLMEYIIEAAMKKFDLKILSHQLDYVRLVGKYLKNVKDPVEREIYVKEISSKLDLSGDEIRKWVASRETPGRLRSVGENIEGDMRINFEEALVGLLLKHPALAGKEAARKALSSLEDPELAEIGKKIIAESGETGTDIESSILIEGEEYASRASRAVLVYEQFFPEEREENLQKILVFMELKQRERKLAKLADDLREEESDGRRGEILKLQMELKREIEEIRKNL